MKPLSLFLLTLPPPPLPSLRMSTGFALVQGWGFGSRSWPWVDKHPGSLLKWWEDRQVDRTHATALEILEDRFTTCQILLVAHSSH